jgi:hypothetical protein
MTDIGLPLMICAAFLFSLMLKLLRMVSEPLIFAIALSIMIWAIMQATGVSTSLNVPTSYGIPLNNLLSVLGLTLLLRKILLPPRPKAAKKAKSKG